MKAPFWQNDAQWVWPKPSPRETSRAFPRHRPESNHWDDAGARLLPLFGTAAVLRRTEDAAEVQALEHDLTDATRKFLPDAARV